MPSVPTMLTALTIVVIAFAVWWFAWSSVLRWLRVVWVCRVPALSGALGIALFWLAEPARDIFLETQKYVGYWSAFFVLLFFWAAIVHYAARKVLEQQAWAARGARLPLDDERLQELRWRYALAATWVPRALGALCFTAVIIGIWGAGNDIGPVEDVLGVTSPRRLLWPTGFCFLAYVIYVLIRRRFSDPAEARKPFGEYLLDQFSGRNATLLVEERAFWFLDLATARGRTSRAAQTGGSLRWDLAAVALFASLAAFWIGAIIAPLQMAELAPRALFVIVTLALPVSLLSFLTALSHQWRLPVVFLTVLVLAVLTGLSPHFHDLRTEPGVSGLSQIPLDQAVKRWMAVNCPSANGDAENCPARPIVLASAGGASRAGFFTATIVGELLDQPDLDLRRRLFAISGVSGGAVGAVMIRAALAVSKDGKAACNRITSDWWGPGENYDRPDKITWKICLQTLLSGDFLSPAVIGLAFRDLFGFLGSSDRAVLLERAFEQHYDAVVQPPTGGNGPNLASYVGQEMNGQRQGWLPLLLLNTTSVATGQRTIISDLLPFSDFSGMPTGIFPTTFDLFRTIACSAARPCAPGPLAIDTGIRLSTAAAASARFPIISPQATIRHDKEVRDELVDGGYFENDGLTTARELAEALRKFKLQPIIVHVTNDPNADQADGPEKRLPRPPPQQWYEGYLAPIEALVATRAGHAAEALDRTRQTVADTFTFQVYDRVPLLHDGQECSFGSAGYINDQAPRMRDLSMSWWLSGAVQEYLDRQLCHPENVDRVAQLKAALFRTAITSKPSDRDGSKGP